MINIRQLIELWKTSFNDSDEFVRLFFERVFRKENVLAKVVEDKTVSALHMLPYTMTFCGSEMPVIYIAGCATAQEYRGKGYMKELMDEALQTIQKRHIPLAVLIPAEESLFEFYGKLGFSNLFDYSVKTVAAQDIDSQEIPPMYISVASDADNISSYMYYQKKMKSNKYCIQHSYTDFITIVKDLEMSHGALFVAKNRANIIRGLVFATFSGDENKRVMFVKEIVTSDDAFKLPIMKETALKFGATDIIYKAPAAEPLSIPYGMAKVTDRAFLTRRWLESNKETEMTKEALDAMSEEEFIRFVFDYDNKAPLMNLMLDD